MYLITVEILEELTLKAPYPSCHAKFFRCSLIHVEELDFTSDTALASGIVGGNRKRRWRWSSMPPTAKVNRSWFLQMAAVYAHKRGRKSRANTFSRFLVLKTRWIWFRSEERRVGKECRSRW